MRGWWTERTGREKALILVAGMLLIAALAWQGAVRPAQGALQQAERGHADALQTLARVQRLEALAAEGRIPAPDAQYDTPAARAEAALRIAREVGLENVRISPAGNGQLSFEGAVLSGPVFFTWAEAMQDRLGLTMAMVSLKAGEDGRIDVNAQLTGARED